MKLLYSTLLPVLFLISVVTEQSMGADEIKVKVQIVEFLKQKFPASFKSVKPNMLKSYIDTGAKCDGAGLVFVNLWNFDFPLDNERQTFPRCGSPLCESFILALPSDHSAMRLVFHDYVSEFIGAINYKKNCPDIKVYFDGIAFNRDAKDGGFSRIVYYKNRYELLKTKKRLVEIK